jgi:hypothetical protein
MALTLHQSCPIYWVTFIRRLFSSALLRSTTQVKFRFVFLEIEASKVMVLGAKVRRDTRELLGHIKDNLYGQIGPRVSDLYLLSSKYSLFC